MTLKVLVLWTVEAESLIMELEKNDICEDTLDKERMNKIEDKKEEIIDKQLVNRTTNE